MPRGSAPTPSSSARGALAVAVGLAIAAATGTAAADEPSAPAPRRGNSVLTRKSTTPVLGVAAAVRMGILVGDASPLIRPPLGFGFGFELRYHALPIAGARLGFEFIAGHDRFPGRNVFTEETPTGTRSGVRYTILGHTDIALGPSLQIPLRVLFLELGGGGGLMISSFRRPTALDPAGDELVVGYDGMIRGDAAIGVPIRNNQGIRIGADVVKPFSSKTVAIDPHDTAEVPARTRPFDLFLDVTVGYQMWF
ncbi:MAG: hypothetical protein R3B09_00590 [Nannocystaceae bacterium]